MFGFGRRKVKLREDRALNIPKPAQPVAILNDLISSLPKPLPFLHMVGTSDIGSGQGISFRPHRLYDNWNTVWSYDTDEDTWSRYRENHALGPHPGSITPLLLPVVLADLGSFHFALVAEFLAGMAQITDDETRHHWVLSQEGALPLIYNHPDTESIARIWVSERIDAWNFSALYLHRVAQDSPGTPLEDLGTVCAGFIPLMQSNHQELTALGVADYLTNHSVREDWDVVARYLQDWDNKWRHKEESQ